MKCEILYGKKILFKLLEDELIMGYTIPNGYVTDFASVPKFLWSILPPLGRHNLAALLHDWMYDNKIGTRKKADKLFLKCMLISGVGMRAYIMYWGVRLFGKKWWVN